MLRDLAPVVNVDEQVPLRVLLVEDNRSEAALVGRLLLMAGSPRFDVVAVHQLTDALDVLERRAMDLVILDLGLPDVANELEGVSEITKRHTVPVVVLTGVESAEDLRAATMRAGAVECLFKEGISPEGLHQALHDAAMSKHRATV